MGYTKRCGFRMEDNVNPLSWGASLALLCFPVQPHGRHDFTEQYDNSFCIVDDEHVEVSAVRVLEHEFQ